MPRASTLHRRNSTVRKLLLDAGLTSSQRELLGAIADRCNDRPTSVGGELLPAGTFFTTREQLALDCGMSDRAVKYGLKRLEQLRLINRSGRFAESGRQMGNLYSYNLIDHSAKDGLNSAAVYATMEAIAMAKMQEGRGQNLHPQGARVCPPNITDTQDFRNYSSSSLRSSELNYCASPAQRRDPGPAGPECPEFMATLRAAALIELSVGLPLAAPASKRGFAPAPRASGKSSVRSSREARPAASQGPAPARRSRPPAAVLPFSNNIAVLYKQLIGAYPSRGKGKGKGPGSFERTAAKLRKLLSTPHPLLDGQPVTEEMLFRDLERLHAEQAANLKQPRRDGQDARQFTPMFSTWLNNFNPLDAAELAPKPRAATTPAVTAFDDEQAAAIARDPLHGIGVRPFDVSILDECVPH